MARTFFEMAEGVDEAGGQECTKPVPLLVAETGIAHVFLRTREVDLFVRDVQVAANDHRLGLFEGLQIGEKITVPRLTVRQAHQLVLRVGHIDVDQIIVGKLHRDHAAFLIVRGDADAVENIHRLMPREHRGAAVTFLHGGVPEGRIAVGPGHMLHIPRVAFGFLEANNIGPVDAEMIEKALLQHGTQAVHIPRDEFHKAQTLAAPPTGFNTDSRACPFLWPGIRRAALPARERFAQFRRSMSVFTHIPLGQRIPASLHGVSASLPTMRDVIGYEEKNPEVTRHMTSGYPRFVVHPFAKRAGAHLLRTLNLAGHAIWLTSSIRAAEQLRVHLGDSAALLPAAATLTGVTFPENDTLSARAKTFLQHTGMFLSSREAEDYLLRVGELAPDQAQDEKSFEGYAPANVKGHLARFFKHAAVTDVFLATSGMNALAATFRVASDLQRPHGRTRWLQLGWLYLDTIALLQKFTDTPSSDYLFQSDVFDLDALKKLFAEQGDRIAGLITEVPTNPLIQTPDLPAIAALCREHGIILVVDPTIASPLNIDVLHHADVVANSLTKYTASDGDVILGAVVVNPRSPHAAGFRARLPGALEPVYSRDVSRLACQIGETPALIAQINRTAPAVVEFLRSHPRIKELYWSLHPASRENYLKIARTPESIGSVISFVVDMPVARFYDRLRLAKGPSFGMNTTLICPFIYLAHYDLVTSESGRATLAAAGLHPELLRLSIGTEPADEIIAALAEALD